jgi:hypothetical protein
MVENGRGGCDLGEQGKGSMQAGEVTRTVWNIQSSEMVVGRLVQPETRVVDCSFGFTEDCDPTNPSLVHFLARPAYSLVACSSESISAISPMQRSTRTDNAL